jgi:hypothetical protein
MIWVFLFNLLPSIHIYCILYANKRGRSLNKIRWVSDSKQSNHPSLPTRQLDQDGNLGEAILEIVSAPRMMILDPRWGKRRIEKRSLGGVESKFPLFFSTSMDRYLQIPT